MPVFLPEQTKFKIFTVYRLSNMEQLYINYKKNAKARNLRGTFDKYSTIRLLLICFIPLINITGRTIQKKLSLACA
jgi:hypothetical protein